MYKTLAVSSTQGDVGKDDMKDFMVAGTTNTGASKGNVFMPSDYLNFSPLYFPKLVNIFPELKSDPTILVEASLNKVKVNKVEGLFRAGPGCCVQQEKQR
ncbi:hypothetical protein HGM15179_008595 [Zosterops borbonicus]|uniref:Uncharacterized protein n=1 Tax=Zosterops borbonicus TaxID=364589 RepID=A0A8K1GGS5_9PASS|nr:hypothetical protein HGM15179_008595 [Zosterops borbonicus]